MQFSSSDYIRLIRIILTIYITYLLTWYVQIPERIWSLITVWFVMIDYEYIGGVIHKSSLRLVGTGISAIYGITVIYLFDNVILINMFAMIPLIFWFAHRYMNQEDNYALTIACVTITITLLGFNDISVGLLRLFNIFIGIIMSVIMMYIFHPKYAYQALPDLTLQILMAQNNLILLIIADTDIDSFIKEKMRVEQIIVQIKKRCEDANYEFKKDMNMLSIVLKMNQVSDLIAGLYWLRKYQHISLDEILKLKTLLTEFEKSLGNESEFLAPVAIHPIIELIYQNLISYRQLYKPMVYKDIRNVYA